MNMSEDERKLLAHFQVEGICKLLNGEVEYSTVWDQAGNCTKKITITYNEKNEKTSS